VQAQQLAIEHGCRTPDLARNMLGWYLLKAGKKDEGEAIFAASLASREDDPDLHGMIGAARADAGDHEGALRAFDRALELAEAGVGPGSAESLTDRFQTRRLQECRLDSA
jgi:predicted Zn-dependent protease